MELNGPKHRSLPEVVDIRLLDPLRPLEPLVPGCPSGGLPLTCSASSRL